MEFIVYIMNGDAGVDKNTFFSVLFYYDDNEGMYTMLFFRFKIYS